MLRVMDGACASSPVASADSEFRLARFAPPRVEPDPWGEPGPFTRAELRAWFHSGEPEAEACERILASACRARGALEVAIAEGLAALREGDRLASLAYHLDDYATEVLDLGRRAAENLARLGQGLRSRPLLREALRAGKVRLRAAQTVLPVASGERESEWVERAARLTVRELEEAVRRAGGGDPGGADEEWSRFGAHLRPDERILLDEGLALAGEILPGSSRMERLEALSQEFLAECNADPDADEGRKLGPAFRPAGPGEGARRAALEAETERWSALEAVGEWPTPDVRFDESATAEEIDSRLRELAALRAGWDDLIGFCAYVVQESGIYRLLGFTSFRHYAEERLGLPARTVEQRAALEKRLSASPALREARRQKVSFEKLRLLARLPEREIAAWTPRARALTCIALARKLEGERERQMRAARKLAVRMPRRIAVLLAAAIQTVRDRADRVLSTGKCLAIIAWHFIETWGRAPRRSRSRSRKVRDRDGGHCQVPGCSHRATHSHHVEFRSRGGGDESENRVALCAFHHLRCIHAGYLRVVGRAPDALTWFLGGKVWSGPHL